MTKFSKAICALMLTACIFTACNAETVPTPSDTSEKTQQTKPDLPAAEASEATTDEPKEKEMKIKVSDGKNEVIFLLNDTSPSKSLYNQLPITVEAENYGSSEKIFYPPEKLDTSDVTEGGGEAGKLAYFSPWGNVVMYYSSFGAYPGLYIMGEAINGAESIEKLSGTVTVTAE